MYKLPKQTRDSIVTYLSNLVVPTSVGYNLTVIVETLSKLEEIPEVKEEKKDAAA